MRFDLHAIRYGEVYSADLEDVGYTEEQCAECLYGHRCCELIVMVTPAEAAGILQWLSRNSSNVMEIARGIQFRAGVLNDHFKNYPDDPAGAITEWFIDGMKCVFYDLEKKECSIYPVRPTSCRSVFGDGDCENGVKTEGIKSCLSLPEVLSARIERYKIHPEAKNNLAELTSLVANMAVSKEQQYVDQQFFKRDPNKLTDEQVMFGLNGAPIANPVALGGNNDRS